MTMKYVVPLDPQSTHEPARSLVSCLRIQYRVLHALMMREIITRFGRENLGVLWLVAEPMTFTLGVAALWTAAGMNHGSSIPIVAFAVTGYSCVLLWRNAASRCSTAVLQNRNLLYHRNVHVGDVLLTRVVVEIGGATGSFIVLSIFFLYIGWMPPPVAPLQIVLGWALLAWFGTALAMLIGAGSAYSEVVERLWHPASYLLFPLSGAAFMVDWMPKNAQKIVLLLPMVHGTEMIRQGWFGDVVRTHFDVGYMATCCLVLTLAALWLTREVGHRIEF